MGNLPLIRRKSCGKSVTKISNGLICFLTEVWTLSRAGMSLNGLKVRLIKFWMKPRLLRLIKPKKVEVGQLLVLDTLPTRIKGVLKSSAEDMNFFQIGKKWWFWICYVLLFMVFSRYASISLQRTANLEERFHFFCIWLASSWVLCLMKRPSFWKHQTPVDWQKLFLEIYSNRC